MLLLRESWTNICQSQSVQVQSRVAPTIFLFRIFASLVFSSLFFRKCGEIKLLPKKCTFNENSTKKISFPSLVTCCLPVVTANVYPHSPQLSSSDMGGSISLCQEHMYMNSLLIQRNFKHWKIRFKTLFTYIMSECKQFNKHLVSSGCMTNND